MGRLRRVSQGALTRESEVQLKLGVRSSKILNVHQYSKVDCLLGSSLIQSTNFTGLRYSVLDTAAWTLPSRLRCIRKWCTVGSDRGGIVKAETGFCDVLEVIELEGAEPPPDSLPPKQASCLVTQAPLAQVF